MTGQDFIDMLHGKPGQQMSQEQFQASQMNAQQAFYAQQQQGTTVTDDTGAPWRFEGAGICAWTQARRGGE